MTLYEMEQAMLDRERIRLAYHARLLRYKGTFAECKVIEKRRMKKAAQLRTIREQLKDALELCERSSSTGLIREDLMPKLFHERRYDVIEAKRRCGP